MDSGDEQVCKSCYGCQLVGQFCVTEPMQRVEPPSGSRQDVAIDVLGPLASAENLYYVITYITL